MSKHLTDCQIKDISQLHFANWDRVEEYARQENALAQVYVAALAFNIVKAELEALQYRYCSVKFLIEELEEDVSGQTSADKLVEGWNNCREHIQKRFKEIQ